MKQSPSEPSEETTHADALISDFWSPNCERIKFWLVKTIYFIVDFPVAQTVKNLPGMQETRVRSLGGEGPLEKGMAVHSSILAWRIPWTEKPGRLQLVGSQRVRHN